MRERGAADALSLLRLGPALGLVLGLWGLSACGQDAAPSPFDRVGEGGADGGSPFEAGLPPRDAGSDPTLGGPCLDDGQCDDGIDCTEDTCDASLERCRFAPIDERCADGVHCNGSELCEPGLGCRRGEEVACSDNTPCTIDRCVESSQSCEHRARDADGDGDTVWNCTGGTDCDDGDARIHGGAAEVCLNQRDDDCDRAVDEADCARPEHDGCSDPLLLEGPGRYEVSLAAANEDFGLSCAESEEARRDVVLALVVPEAGPSDWDIVATSEQSGLTLAVAERCADASSELACAEGVPRPVLGGSVARVILRGLTPGTYPVIVSATSDVRAEIEVRAGAPPAPENETCGGAIELVPGQSVQVSLAGVARDLTTECSQSGGEVVYRFELAQPADVELSAAALDDFGVPWLSLRGPSCAPAGSELTCRTSQPAALFARALPAGTYHVALGASGPSDVDLMLLVSEPTTAPDDEGCEVPPLLEPGVTREIDLAHRVDAVRSACGVGRVDATYALELEGRSDVLLVERLSLRDTGSISLFAADCRRQSSLACESSDDSPLRVRALGLDAGEYRVVAESAVGSPIALTAFTRPARPATLVAFADRCDDAVTIPESGGRFQGNTSNAEADFGASCDFGSGPLEGARDQLLRLELSAARRVILDLGPSRFETLLAVRRAEECPGSELENACAPGYRASRSFLDLTLPAGEYFVQIDGYDGASGAWSLDVFTAPP